MFPTPNQTTVSHSLLAEAARSAVFPDPALFVYGVLGTLVFACLLMGYLTVGRSGRHHASDLES
ncbi:MAG: hypothetical protein WAU39_06710 [Polyangiales bacterium]